MHPVFMVCQQKNVKKFEKFEKKRKTLATGALTLASKLPLLIFWT
jgi:hypothetical protein